MMKRVVVVCLGNPLMGDDGIGQAVYEHLCGRLPDFVELVEAGCDSLDALLDARDAERVILVDAIDAEEEPGTLFRFDAETIRKTAMPRMHLSLHELSLKECLALAELSGFEGDKLVVVGMQPAVVEPRMRLSDTVAEKLPDLIDLIEQEIRRVCDDKNAEKTQR